MKTNNIIAIHEAYEQFKVADNVWQNWLEYTFGKVNAGDMRYRLEGKTHPNCKLAYDRFVEARDTWMKLTDEARNA